MAVTEKFTTVFTENDFLSGDVTIKADEYQKIGEFKVEAGQLIRLGAGNNPNQSDSYGRIYADLRDNAAAPGAKIEGIVRFVVHSPQGRPLRILKEMHTADLNTSATDVRLQKAFEEFGPFVSEDKKIVIELKPSAIGSGTLSKAQSTLRMHVTEGVA